MGFKILIHKSIITNDSILHHYQSVRTNELCPQCPIRGNRIDIRVVLGTGEMGKQKGSSWQERKYWEKLLKLGTF